MNGLSIPVFLSWVWLKQDGKRVQRLIISTKQMKGKTIARWGKFIFFYLAADVIVRSASFN